MRYTFHEASLVLPADVRDDSVQVLTIPVSGATPLSLTIHRQPVLPDRSLGDLAQNELNQIAQRSEGFEKIWSRDHQLDGRDACIVAIRYDMSDSPIAQRLVYIKNDDSLLKMTVSVQGDFTSEQLAVLNAVASSLRFTASAAKDGQYA
ncbi:DcrB-related protein [Acetobacter sacchari]|nr:DcrB-related protein [Acetobacter sacchari]